MRNICRFSSTRNRCFFLNINLIFSFEANRWLSDEKDDKKTFIDLLPSEQEAKSKKGIEMYESMNDDCVFHIE